MKTSGFKELTLEELEALHIKAVNEHDEVVAKSKDSLKEIRMARDRKLAEKTLKEKMDNLNDAERELLNQTIATHGIAGKSTVSSTK